MFSMFKGEPGDEVMYVGLTHFHNNSSQNLSNFSPISCDSSQHGRPC